MKKKSMTLTEIIIGISLMTVLATITITTVQSYMTQDTDLMKFKHVYATVSEVIYELKNDSIMYSDASKGFGDTSSKSYPSESKIFGGKEKFKKLFKSKFNIYKNDMNVNCYNEAYPVLNLYNKQTQSEEITYNSKLVCFIDNKGIMYCPPLINFDSKKYSLTSFFIPVYINKINLDNPNTYGVSKTIFFEISKKGKINLPATVGSIVDCHDKKYNEYMHCRVIDKMTDLDF